ncbi:MAG: hypothetical protein L0387_24565 [Acidobacteria bacterium]|nr:hypothetical protein [Acidobacteriota bacterium]
MATTGDSAGEHEPGRFAGQLEERVRQLTNATRQPSPEFSVTSLIEDELLLTVEQLDKTRERWRVIEQDLLQAECYIETELMQMEQRTPRYSPYRFPEREKLQKRLMGIAQERRRLIVSTSQSIDELHQRLLSLLHKHKQLVGGW